MNKLYKNLVFLIMLLIPVSIFSQSFSISEVDGTNFPWIRASFVALDAAGASYKDLKVSDFNVLENSISMNPTLKVECIDTLIDPAVSVVMVVDQSGSMNELDTAGKRRWDWVLKGAKNFLNTLKFGNGTTCAIVSFGSIAYLRSPFSDDRQALIDSLEKIYVSGATRYDPPFLDYNIGAIELLKSRPSNMRRIIVFLTDGDPNIPPSTDSIIRTAQASNVQVYSITLTMPMNLNLGRISKETGGKSFAVYTETELNSIYKLIALDIQSKQFCNLIWKAPYGCSEASRTRLADITFNRLGERLVRTYTAPPNSLAQLSINEQVTAFGDPPVNTSTTADITLTAATTAFKVNNIKIQPNTYFDVVNWDVGGSGGAPPFTIDSGKTRKIQVRFTQGSSPGYRTATLIAEGDPCNGTSTLVGGLNQVRIINPVGGEVFSTCDTIYIKWAGVESNKPVTLSYSNDGGKTWTIIKTNATGLIYSWNPPAPNTNYLIRAVVNSVQSYMWSKNIGDTGNDVATSLAMQNDDMYGYVAGHFENTVKFDKLVTSRGAKDGFLVKFDVDGNIIWNVSIGGPGIDTVSGVVCDAAGNPFIVGTCYSGTQFGSLMPNFSTDNAPYCFVAKYASTGGAPVVAFIGPTTLYPTFKAWGIKIRYAPGTILVQGQYLNLGKFGSFTLPKVTVPTYFTATYSEDLQLNMLAQGIVNLPGYSAKSDYDSKGNLYDCGSFSNSMRSGTITINSNGGVDAFYRKYGGTPGSQDTTKAPFEVFSPQIKLSIKDLDIGKATLGYSKDSIVKAILCNTGKKPVKIASYNFSGNNPGDFTLTTNITGVIIQPGDCINLEFNFAPKDVANRSAQFNVNGTCNEFTSLNVYGYGVCSGLVEEFVAFGNVNMGLPKTITLNCAIKNTNPGSVQMDPIIVGPNKDDFSLNPTGTVILASDSCYKVEVIFNPKTPGPKVAYIDYRLPTGCETMQTQLNGNAYNADYAVEGTNWGDRRQLTVNDSFVVFNNKSVLPVKILKIELDNPAVTQFKIGNHKALPFDLNAGDTVRIPVTFTPDVIGSFNNFVKFTVETTSDPFKAQISGNGVLPIMTTILDCGTSIKLGEEKKVSFKISNTSTNSDLYVKSLSFVDPIPKFTWVNTKPANFTIKKGTDTTIILNFKPKSIGINSNIIEIVADDTTGPGPNFFKTTTVVLSCEAVGLEYPSSFDMGAHLQCSDVKKKITVTNKSWTSDVTISGYYFEKNNADSSVFKVTLPANSTIKANTSLDIELAFKPDRVKNYSTRLYFNLSDGDVFSIPITGKSYIVDIYTSFANEDEKKLKIGFSKEVKVKGHIENLENTNINQLTVRLKYDDKMLFYNNQVNGGIQNHIPSGWTWDAPTIVSPGILEVKGTGVLPTAFNRDLFSVWFKVYLSDVKETTISFNHYIANCNTIDTLGATYPLAGVCFLSGTLIKLTDTHFFLNLPEPNPSISNTNLKFGVGFKTNVKIDVINAQGNTVLNAVNQELESGEYNLSILLNDFPAGVYFIRYNAGENVMTQKLIKQ